MSAVKPHHQIVTDDIIRFPPYLVAVVILVFASLLTMNASTAVAGWLSFAATAIGLGGLISQANAINDKMDPFHDNRTVEYLGVWIRRQRQFPWYVIAKPAPVGPVVQANMADGFCTLQTIYLTRVPHTTYAKAGWSTLLSEFHPKILEFRHASSPSRAEKGSVWSTKAEIYLSNDTSPVHVDPCEWDALAHQPLVRYQGHACTVVSRTTLITLLVCSNAKPSFQHSGPAGYRAGFASYVGQWYITWPIGQDAMVKLLAHDSHRADTDVYPPCFRQRVDRCMQMASGVITGSGAFEVAFCGRKHSGTYRLKHVAKGFGGAHGSRHLFNMLGGKVYNVDFMTAERVRSEEEAADTCVLELPSRDKTGSVMLEVPQQEEAIIKHALDCLPWNTLSFSLHRGLKDILLAYCRPIMDAHRQELARLLKNAVYQNAQSLERLGYHPQFVRHNMADMAHAAILSCGGDSGDLVRIVTDIARTLVSDWDFAALDEVHFWRKQESAHQLDQEGVVALTKVFVVEWSQDFDYQMYHELPTSLYFA